MIRCRWAAASAIESGYHDVEWGVPLHDEVRLFEFLILEGAQAGLSWRTVLEKRDNYRTLFDGFEPEVVALYDEQKVKALLNEAGIIRNRLKIEAAVKNAQAYLRVQAEYGSFDGFIWGFVDGAPVINCWERHEEIPAYTPLSERMSDTLKQKGFSFVGRTICYAYMQAIGMVNDHTTDCFRYSQLLQTSAV